MYDLFNNTDNACTLLTETWMKNDGNFDQIHDDIVNNKGLGIISYNRPGKRKGGGVAIVFDKKKINLEEYKFRTINLNLFNAAAGTRNNVNILRDSIAEE